MYLLLCTSALRCICRFIMFVLLFIVVYWLPTNNECLVSPGLEIRKPNIGSRRESQHTHTHMYRWKHGGIIGGLLGKKIGLKCSLKIHIFT